MRRVIVESPYSGDVEKNFKYAREAMLDCIRRGESPLASHLLYPQILDDNSPHDRDLGIKLGFAWNLVAHMIVIYTDLGTSIGMMKGIEWAREQGIPVEYRTLDHDWDNDND